MSFELRDRESTLIARFPRIPWLEPQPVMVEHETVLTCRFCTALDGLKGIDVIAGRLGFADVDEFVEHLQRVHVSGEA